MVGEVGDESRLRYDRTTKLGIYARAGFPEYWILNLVDRRLEVHRRPLPGGIYGDVRYYEESDVVEVGTDSAKIAVAELLPPSAT
jgi:Uma2 family endonuclease